MTGQLDGPRSFAGVIGKDGQAKIKSGTGCKRPDIATRPLIFYYGIPWGMHTRLAI